MTIILLSINKNRLFINGEYRKCKKKCVFIQKDSIELRLFLFIQHLLDWIISRLKVNTMNDSFSLNTQSTLHSCYRHWNIQFLLLVPSSKWTLPWRILSKCHPVTISPVNLRKFLFFLSVSNLFEKKKYSNSFSLVDICIYDFS